MKNTLLSFMEKTGRDYEFKLFLDLIQRTPRGEFAVIQVGREVFDKRLDVISEELAYLCKLDIYPIVILQHSSFDSKDMLKERVISNGGRAAFASETDFSKIDDLLDNGIIPIVCGRAGEDLEIDAVSNEIVKVKKPRKLIILSDAGGLFDSDNNLIKFLNVSSGDKLENFSEKTNAFLKNVEEFLLGARNCSLVVASPKNFLKEIFTIEGSGTFVKHYMTNSQTNLDSVDKDRLVLLLNDAFGKKLVSDYFSEPVLGFFWEEQYDGAAIVKEVDGVAYLDKFAVIKAAQGTGLGKSIWARVVSKYPKIIWRATLDNPTNRFYVKNCDGMIKGKEWVFYWKGLDLSEVPKLYRLVVGKRPTMV